ncbi:MAG TPA: OsmC family protein [Ktedonobacterales bacterium]
MPSEKYATVTWMDELRFDAEAGVGHQHITLDGAGLTGQSPMDLLLTGLAGCTGMDVISILRKMRQEVTGLRIEVRGRRAEEHPKVYTDVTIEFVVTGHGVQEESVRRAIELSETKYCSVGATIAKTARITSTFRIEEAGA